MKGKKAMLIKPMEVEIQEYDPPEINDDSILLEVLQTNICGSDLHVVKGLHPVVQSGMLGHEMVGRIVKLGRNVKTDHSGNPIKIGDRIVPSYFVTCNKCRECLAGNQNHCINWAMYAGKVGTIASYYTVYPGQYFFKVPEEISNHVAAGANCALSQVIFGLEKVDLKPGTSIVIQGAGGLGLYACAVAKEKGAKVIIIDNIPSRLELAKKFGADEVIDMNQYNSIEERTSRVKELTDDWGADFGLEVTGVPSAFSEGIHLIKQNGKYVVMGNVMTGHTTEFDPGLLVRKAIQIIPVHHYNPEYLYMSLQFLERNLNKYPFDELLDGIFSLDEVQLALEKSINREVTRATIVVNK